MQKSGAVQSALDAHDAPEPPKPGLMHTAGETVPQPGGTPICGVPVVNCRCVRLQQLQPGTVVVVVDVVVVVVVVGRVVVVVDVVVVVVGRVVVVVEVVVVVVGRVVVVVEVVDVVVVVVVGAVVVVVGAVVVVVPPAQLPAVHASQQLGCVPTQADPPSGADEAHACAESWTLHVVAPLACVRQHVTKPGFPHVELDAQLLIALAHSMEKWSALTACDTHETY